MKIYINPDVSGEEEFEVELEKILDLLSELEEHCDISKIVGALMEKLDQLAKNNSYRERLVCGEVEIIMRRSISDIEVEIREREELGEEEEI